MCCLLAYIPVWRTSDSQVFKQTAGYQTAKEVKWLLGIEYKHYNHNNFARIL